MKGEDHLKLFNFWTDTSWDWSKLSFEIPPDFLAKASKISLTNEIGHPNIPYWIHVTSGIFSTHSVRQFLATHSSKSFPFLSIGFGT